VDEIDKELDNSNQLTENRLRELAQSKDGPHQKESYLSDDKLRSIMSFLDEVQVSDRLSAVEQVTVWISFFFFSSPELKAQVSYSDGPLSVVRLFVCL
jgi:hypothetical protein